MIRFQLPTGWQTKHLSEVATVQTGVALGRANLSDAVWLPYLRVANVQDGYFDLREVKTIEIPKHEVARYSLQKGDVLFTEGGDFDKLGRGAVWNGEIPNCVHQNHVFAVRVDPAKVLSSYLAAYSSSFQGRTYFLGCSKQTTNLASINSTQLKEMPLALPPLTEQKKIAAILSTWDRAIELTEKLIAAKQKRKAALMQRLLTGRVRLSEFSTEPWETTHLGNHFAERREAGFVELPLLSITATEGIVHRDTLDKKDSSNADKSAYLRICPGDIGYNTMRMWQGVSAVSAFEGIVSPAYTVCVPKASIDARFASYLFKFPAMIHIFRRHSQGLVDDTLNLKFASFRKIKVALPCNVSEQRAIAALLNTQDWEIALQTRKLDALRRQKKGLMQQLLTGKVRVKVTESSGV